LEIGKRVFTLPHDTLDALETVSDSSSLYTAYMELFRELFPFATKTA
jgi:hypothetical protein